MTTGTYECLPTAIVLLNGGSMGLDELASKLVSADPSRFRDFKNVEQAVNIYSNCLENNGGRVEYNKNSKTYSKYDSALHERSVQRFLHQSVPNMKDWQLYPFKTPSNSEACYMKIPWTEIPEDTSENYLQEKYRRGVNYKCDFRCKGKDFCNFGCGIDDNTIRKYFYVTINGIGEDELIDRLGEKEFEKRFKDVTRTLERKNKEDVF